MTAFSLQPLRADRDVQDWLSNWRRGIELVNDVLSLPTSALRIRMYGDPEVIHLVDSFLDIYPRKWSKSDDALSVYVSETRHAICSAAIREVVAEMYTKILMLYMRLATDGGEEFNSYVANAQGLVFPDSDATVAEAFLEKCLAGLDGVATVLLLLHNEHVSGKITSEFLNSLALFTEQLIEEFSMASVVTASAELRKTYKRLFPLVDNVIASAYALFHAIIGHSTSADELYTVIANCLQYERFIVYYSIIYPIEEVIARCDKEQKIFISDTLAHIRSDHTKSILQQLRNRGLLADLGQSADREVQETIGFLVELLPHFSRQFIHLCLRHFGCQREQTTNALLNINELPLDLRALMAVELKAEYAPAVGTDALLFYDFDHADTKLPDNGAESTASSNAKQMVEPLICMKPPESAVCKQLSQADACEAETVRGAAAVTEESKSEDGKKDWKSKFGDEEFLQKRNFESAQIKSKLPLVESFDVPESEKVPMRPSYERYRYEGTSSSKQNIYDDEFDDTYADFQGYDLDFREGDAALLKSGIEPNTNRMQMEEEEEDESNETTTGNGKEHRVTQSGSARRKTQLKNNPRSVSGTAVSNERTPNGVLTEQSGRGKNAPQEVTEPSGSGREFRRRPDDKRKPGYTGGRDRQLKEQHKGEFRRRQADKKMRNGMF